MPRLPIGDIGPCCVVWDWASTKLCITPYLGTVTLRWADTINDVQEEGYGDAPVDGVFGGSVVELEVPMVRSSLEQLEQTIAYESMGSKLAEYVILHNMAGIDMYARAKIIVIAPMYNNKPSQLPPEYHQLYKCHPWRDYELTWDRSGQRIHMVKFKVFPNQDDGFCGEYGTEGMPSTEDPINNACGAVAA